MAIAEELIGAAKRAGADAVKLQYFRADELATSDAMLAPYQSAAKGMSEYVNQLDMLSRLELSLSQLKQLQDVALSMNIDYLVSVFSSSSASEALGALSISTLKIPSGEINNEELIRISARSGLDLIISTGMSDLSEVSRAIDWIKQEGVSLDRVEVLQCTTSYPTETHEVNLLAMVQIARELEVRVGFSDHTNSNIAALGAVALGASTIEKHITLDREMDGPDHQASTTPKEFADLVAGIRQMSASLGNGIKRPSFSEQKTLYLVRKSPVATKKISKGEQFTQSNIALRRPQNGMDGSLMSELIGRQSRTTYSPGDTILPDELTE